ncbi:thioesterase II family protein [Streptacidiphilus sp. P02-A3a]|uniref:thioesterase II family protein n=1 Tax=Streptacidiphilus sp. P02-A3a TaxID=2704468 RepID=UPI0015F87519|nr:alpha/beta fold hydrolase [Streptacidiphilus sp. P02-A3a]QMU70037.1 thioesterase [Streptacidiphilus sp. P02-A3a]
MIGTRQTRSSRWWTGRSGQAAERTLVCLPYAGGGPQTYQDWEGLLPTATSVLAVTPPGRGRRFGETPCRDVPSMVLPLTGELAVTLDGPYTLFGHSLGATTAFELCREIRRRGLRGPTALVVSGRQAPDLPWTEAPISGLPDAEFADALRELGGTPEAVLQQPELMRILLPSLRADFAIVEAYRYQDEAPLDIPILALAGTDDRRAPVRRMSGWARQTNASFTLRTVRGGHFFVDTEPAVVTGLLSAVV